MRSRLDTGTICSYSDRRGAGSLLLASVTDGLAFIRERLVVPRAANIREQLFQLAHDDLGHFRSEKSYAGLRPDLYGRECARNSRVHI